MSSTVDLQEILNGYPLDSRHALMMRESIRMKRRKNIRESMAPQTGAYWWVPSPAQDGIKWDVVEFYDSDHGDNTLHMDMWPHVLELLAIRWGKDHRALENLDNYYTGLPRGRVGMSPLNGKLWIVNHGNDAPVPNAEKVILRAFNLSGLALNGKVKFAFDEHEQMEAKDCVMVQNGLGVNLGLKGVDLFAVLSARK